MTGFHNGSDVARIDSKQAAAIASKVEDYDALVHDAAEATSSGEDELEQGHQGPTQRHPFLRHPSLAVVMEGYDTLLLGNFFAQPAFAKNVWSLQRCRQVRDPRPLAVGSHQRFPDRFIIGLQFTGIASERFGYRKTILVALVFMTGFIFIPSLLPTLPSSSSARFFRVFPGVFSRPYHLLRRRSHPVALVLSLPPGSTDAGLLVSLSPPVSFVHCQRTDHWAYKIPYAIQWIWPVPIFIGCWFAPESPWWLVRQNRLEDAKHSLRRLAANDREFSRPRGRPDCSDDDPHQRAREGRRRGWILLGLLQEDRCSPYRDRLCRVAYPSLLRWSSHGLVLLLLHQGGLPDQAFNLSIGQFAMGLVGTLSSWFLLRKIGRRLSTSTVRLLSSSS